MKKIIGLCALISLFAVSNIIAMQKYEKECPLSYNKFEAMRKMVIKENDYRLEHRFKMLADVYAEFVKECQEETQKNKKEALIEAVGPELAKKIMEDPKSVTVQK